MKLVRLTAYVSMEEFKRLRIKLIKRGLTISAWVREHINKELKSKD